MRDYCSGVLNLPLKGTLVTEIGSFELATTAAGNLVLQGGARGITRIWRLRWRWQSSLRVILSVGVSVNTSWRVGIERPIRPLDTARKTTAVRARRQTDRDRTG